MGMLVYHGDLADNHPFSDRIDSMQRHVQLDQDLIEGLKLLEETQNICPIFEGYQRHEPNQEQLGLMCGITDRIKLTAHEMVSAAA